MRTGIVDFLSLQDAVRFPFGTCPELHRTDGLPLAVAIQWTHRRKFERKCPHEGRNYPEGLGKPQEHPDIVEGGLQRRSRYHGLRAHADWVWHMASLLE